MTFDMFQIFEHNIRRAFDYDVVYAFDDKNIIVTNETVGAKLHEGKRLTRESFFTLNIGLETTARTMMEKNEYFRSHWDYVKNEIEMFLKDYIKTYFPDPITDFIALESLEILDKDPKTLRSLQKISVLAKMKEYEVLQK